MRCSQARADHEPSDGFEVALTQSCDGDNALHERVLALLQANEEAGTFLQHPPTEVHAFSIQSTVAAEQVGIQQTSEGPGSWIDRYKRLQQIGEGGM